MKNLFTNLFLFVALSITFSILTACSNTASTQKGPVSETTPVASNATSANGANTETNTVKANDYPPAPTGILQNEIKDLEGNTFKIEDKKGKVVLLNLWATWCGPCREEMPELIALEEKYKDKNFEVIGLNTDDESAEAIKAFAEKMKLNYQLAYADSKLMSEFVKVTRLAAIQQPIIINREGRMVYAKSGGGQRIVQQIKEAVEKTDNE